MSEGVAANEAEWERPPPKPPPLARPVAARAEASGWRAGGGTYERPRVVGVVHKLLVLLGGREDLDEARVVRLQLRESLLAVGVAAARVVRGAQLLLRREELARELGVRALELGGARVRRLERLRVAVATRARVIELLAHLAQFRLLQLDRRLLRLRQPVDAALLRAERRLQLGLLGRQPLDHRLQLRDARLLLALPLALLRRERLRLAEPAAQFLDRRRERRALLARARELQLGEAQLVAKLELQRLHLAQCALVCVVPLHLLLRALGELRLRALVEVVDPRHLGVGVGGHGNCADVVPRRLVARPTKTWRRGAHGEARRRALVLPRARRRPRVPQIMPLEDGSPSYLDKIVAQRRLDVAAAKASVSEDALRAQIAAQSPVHDFVAALRRQELAVLAEMKRASPSKGDIAVGVDAAQQGLTYALAGACTVSVLTCPTGFKGSLDDMARVRRGLDEAALEPPVCVLRKDFVIDAYQLLEARAHGADTALLIVNILSADELAALMAASRALGMEPLVEVNTEAEMTVALAAGAKVIGVNNRNLHTFKVDMGTTVRLAAMVPPASGIELLALSGVGSRDDALSFACLLYTYAADDRIRV